MSNVLNSSYKPVRTDPNDNKDDIPKEKPKTKRKTTSFSVQEAEEDDPRLTSCGLGSWRPQWLQMFASPVFFMINFALIGVIQGMTGTYFVGSMSTLEKRFAFDSKISGFILIADNLSQMLVSHTPNGRPFFHSGGALLPFHTFYCYLTTFSTCPQLLMD